ncbi:MAG: transposase [Bacillota bacterium]|nr:transposase [Bacillota bacterium]
MAIIQQISLFKWQDDIEILGDLERLKLALENLPDEQLMSSLESERGRGRDDYPIRSVWNSILAGIVFQHPSTASLIRELNRNVQLRYLCGFDHINKVPQVHNYSRFIARLLQHQEELDLIFTTLVKDQMAVLPDFGQRLAMDSKYIQSYAQHQNKHTKEDRRRDTDANLGMKKYHGIHKDGTPWEKVVKCFGFKLHLIVDATYELLACYHVTPAADSDVIEGHNLVDKLAAEQAKIAKQCRYLSADKGYDDSKPINKLMDEPFLIKPIIDTRRLWKSENEKEVPGYKTVNYNEQGQVFCYDLQGGIRRTMICDGYESTRNCLRKKCPAKAYGIECASYGRCPCQGGVRIPLETDYRIFTAVARSSYKCERENNHRTSVERVNGRLDFSLGFDKHTIRGKKKMTMHCSLALILMLTMALGRIRQKQPDLMRSLVRTA